MAPTSTNDNSNPTNQAADGSDDTNKVSLYIAISALAISSLLAAMQLLFSYVTAATSRNKTNAAALGGWSRHTKHDLWQSWKGKLRIYYGVMEMELSQESFFKDHLMKTIIRQVNRKENMKHLDGYEIENFIQRETNTVGVDLVNEVAYLVRAGDPNKTPVPMSDLTRAQRAAWARIQATQTKKRPPPSLASWVTLAQHLGCGFDTFKPTRWEDADRIPIACGAPLITIRMSDVILLGYLLDMSIRKCEPTTGDILLTGPQCKIYTEHLPNVGLVSRYDVKSYKFFPAFEITFGLEPDVLMDTARGSVGFSETRTSFELLGYNSINALMDLFLDRVDGNGWQEIALEKTLRVPTVVGDENGRWNRKWSHPQTNLVALILSTMCAPAVAKAFPHKLIRPWQDLELHRATKDAAAALQGAGYILLAPPTDFIPALFEKQYIKHNIYKVADNYGCESGGLRSFLSTNLAEFTKQVTSCWSWSATDESRATHPVPILSELIGRFLTGESLKDWTTGPVAMGDYWILRPRSALWLQVTMLDTWIGYMIDQLMGETAMREVPLPAEVADADACAETAATLPQGNAFNPVRGKWLKIYLERLAEGRDGRGDSFMSSNPRPNLAERWESMERGTPSQWLALDAVLTLRASAMHAMLIQLDNSSVLLALREYDPLLYMS